MLHCHTNASHLRSAQQVTCAMAMLTPDTSVELDGMCMIFDSVDVSYVDSAEEVTCTSIYYYYYYDDDDDYYYYYYYHSDKYYYYCL